MKKIALTICFLLSPLVVYLQSDVTSWQKHFSAANQFLESKDYQKAINEYQLAYSVAKEIFTAPDENLEKNLFFLGKACLLNKDYEEGIKWFKLDLQSNESILNANLPDKAIILNDIGYSYAGLGDHEKAIEYYESSLRLISDKNFEPDQKVLILQNVATSHNELHNFSEASRTYEEIGNVFQSYPAKFPKFQLFKNQYQIAEAQQNAGNIDLALQLYDSLVNNEDLDSESKFNLLNIISNIHFDKREIETAFDHRYKALELAKAEFPDEAYWNYLEENLAIAAGITHLPHMTKLAMKGEEYLISNAEAKEFVTHSFYVINSELYLLMNEFELALEKIEKAVELAEKRSGDGNPELTEAIKARTGDIYRKMGVYSSSSQAYLDYIDFFENNAALHENAYYKDLYISCLIKQAENFKDISQPQDSKVFLHRAIKNCDLAFRSSNSSRFYLLRGKIFYGLGDYRKAKESFENAVENSVNLGDYYESRNGMVRSAFRSGDQKKAEDLFDSLYQELWSKDYVLKAFEYKRMLADLHFETGNFEQALQLYESFYEAYKEPLINFELIKKMLIASAELGKKTAAYDLMEEYFVLREKNIEGSYHLLGPRGQDGFFDQIKKDVQLFQALVFNKNWNEPLFNTLLFKNTLKYNGVLGRARNEMINELSTTAEPALTELIGKDLINKQISSNSNNKKFTNNRGGLFDRKENENLKMLFKIYAQRYPQKKLLETNWGKNLEFLNSDDVILQFSSFKYLNDSNDSDRHYLVYIMKKDWESPQVTYLLSENELQSKLKGTGNSSYITRGSTSRSLKPKEELNIYLYSEIFQPLEKFLSPGDNIYFSLDGTLNTIALSALKKNTQTTPIIHHYNLIQVNNIRDLHKIVPPSNESIKLIGGSFYGYDKEGKERFNFGLDMGKIMVQNGIIAKEEYSDFGFYEELGQPQESNSNRNKEIDTEKYFATTTWNYLEGTTKEVESIESIFKEHNFKADIFTGMNATEDIFKSFHINSPKVIHVATHGFFDPDNAYFQIANSLKEENYFSFENSMSSLNNSGLILSFGDYAWTNGLNPYEREDGILTAREISHLNLNNTDLVVLSACETGLGEIASGEGIFGLQWAFRLAGVENLIMSLWEVPDLETMEFMELFYNNWFEGKTAREAFNQTQKEMSLKYAESPEKWAAFIMVQ